MSEVAEKRLVTSEKTKPCGCHLTEYSDDTVQVMPCVPCGLLEAARALSGAAGALGAVAHRLRMDQQEEFLKKIAHPGV